MVSLSIREKQRVLVEEVNQSVFYFVEVQWANQLGSIHVWTKRAEMKAALIRLADRHTAYWGREYQVTDLRVKEIHSRNPHVFHGWSLAQAESDVKKN